MVSRPSRSVGSDWQALPQYWVWSAGPPAVSGVVTRPSRSVRSGRQALLKCREWSEGLPTVLGVVESPSHSTGVVSRPS